MANVMSRVLLVPVVRKGFSPIVEFYNNLPVYPTLEELKQHEIKSESPLFHIGSVMPLPDADAAALKQITAMSVKENMVAVEVGSWTGRSTSIIAAEAAHYHGNVYAIDHWEGSPDVWQYDITKTYNIFSVFQHNMKVLGLAAVTHPLVMDSSTASIIFKDNSIDFVFIDADHRYSGVKKDIMTWLPKLKKGGIISGHDCEGYYSKYSDASKRIIDEHLNDDYVSDIPCHPGVVKAVHEIFHDKYTVVSNSAVWYCVKNWADSSA